MRNLVTFIIVSTVAVPANGDLIAYQAFDDPQVDSSIHRKDFGDGFDSPWKPWGGAPNNTDLFLREGSLEYPGLLTSGNHVAGGDMNSGWVGLSQDLQEQSEPTTTKYLSFLVRLDGSVMNGFGVMIDGSRRDVGAGASLSSSGNFMIEQFYNVGTRSSDVFIERDETSLLVVKADIRDGNDEFTLYVNPVVGEAEPTEGIVKDDMDIGDVRGIGIGASGLISVDEIRWGDTFADVTPSITPATFGDFDRDGLLTAADIDSLVSAFDLAPTEVYDLNTDGMVDANDHAFWVTDVANTWFGDANLDGVFDSQDFVDVFQAGTYETGNPAGWSEGDWDGNQLFDSADLVLAFQDGGYDVGPRANASTVAVPEPSCQLLILLGVSATFVTRFRGKVVGSTENGRTKSKSH